MKNEDIDKLFKEKIKNVNRIPSAVGWNKKRSWNKLEKSLFGSGNIIRRYFFLSMIVILIAGSVWLLTDITNIGGNDKYLKGNDIQEGMSDNALINSDMYEEKNMDNCTISENIHRIVNLKEQDPEDIEMLEYGHDELSPDTTMERAGDIYLHKEGSNNIDIEPENKSMLFSTGSVNRKDTIEFIGPNLVPNHSFEDYRKKPKNFTANPVKVLLPDWNVPTKGTPDYFNRSGKGDVGVPENFAGRMNPKEGDGYVGIYLRADFNGAGVRENGSDEGYREYIQAELKQPLQKGKLYFIKVHYSWATNSKYAVDGLGVYLSEDQLTRKHNRYLSCYPQISNPWGNIMKNKNSWQSLSGVYKAKGDEKYITIGNFKPDKETRFIRFNNKRNTIDYSYYYIDDVYVIKVEEKPCKIITKNTDNESDRFENVSVGESVILKNIFFDFDRSELLPASFVELNKLYELLKKNSAMEIKVEGHTDYFGSDEYNLQLSDRRAKAVIDYLTGRGIDEKRLSWEGYGKSHPITEDKSPEGRQKNRRVEFVITKK